MNRYKYDTHVHTSETSICGKIAAKEVVQLYKEADYQGIVITEHYFEGFFDSLEDINWEEKIDNYLLGYKAAFSEGQKTGLKVLLGIEITFKDNPNDFLVYGIDEAFLKENKELYMLNLETFKSIIKNKNILIIQAHPFRHYTTPVNPELLDGVEVYNGNPRHDSQNHLAYKFAEDNNLKKLSGSDFHQIVDLAKGGIILDKVIEDSFELVNIIKSNNIIELMTKK